MNLLCDMKGETELSWGYTIMILTGEIEESYAQ